MKIEFTGKRQEKFGGKAQGVKFRVPAALGGARVVVFSVIDLATNAVTETTDAPLGVGEYLSTLPGYGVHVEAKAPRAAPEEARPAISTKERKD